MSLGRVGFTAVPPGPRPGFDHADTYQGPEGGRLYVAHTGADRIDVLDCRTGRYLRAIEGVVGVAGVLIDTERRQLFTTDRGASRVSIFDCAHETLLVRVAVGARPNGLAYDGGRGNLFTFDLGEPMGTACTASVIAVGRGRVQATIPLPGRPRWAVFDQATDAVYANISEPAVIAVIDAGALAIRRLISVTAAGPHGLAIVAEDAGATLWCAADGGALVVIDRDSGETLATLPLPGPPDVVVYDRARARLYVAVGSPGSVSAFDVRGRAQLERIDTEEGAHTIGWDPATCRLFVFQPKSCGVAIYEDR